MINTRMKEYSYCLLAGNDEYGQPKVTEAQGTIKMSLALTSQSIQNNINYSNANFIGLTLSDIDDKYIINYEDKRLKVLYVFTGGRYKQVFLQLM